MATSDLFRSPKTGERKVENRWRNFRAPPRTAVPVRKIRKRRKMLNHASRFPLNKVRIEIFRAHLFWFYNAKSKLWFKTVGVFLEGNQFFYCKMDNHTSLLLKLRFLKLLKLRRFMFSYCNFGSNISKFFGWIYAFIRLCVQNGWIFLH